MNSPRRKRDGYYKVPPPGACLGGWPKDESKTVQHECDTKLRRYEISAHVCTHRHAHDTTLRRFFEYLRVAAVVHTITGDHIK